jgi:hypothetical protein
MQAALEAYLLVKPDETPNTRKLEEAWTSAARIATAHFPQRAADVSAMCARNLLAAGKPEAAAALYQQVGDRRAAVAVLAKAGLVDRAQKVAAGNLELEELVGQLSSTGGERLEGEERVAGVSTDSAAQKAVAVPVLEDHARRGNWAQVRDLPQGNRFYEPCTCKSLTWWLLWLTLLIPLKALTLPVQLLVM